MTDMMIYTLLKTAFTQIKSLLYKMGLIKDYVTAQGTSGIWTYRKWASGIAECWNTELLNITGSTTSGPLMGGYYAQLNSPSWGRFPFDFIEDPNIAAMGRLGSGGGYVNVFTNKTNVTTVSCTGNQNSKAINGVSMRFIGKWK